MPELNCPKCLESLTVADEQRGSDVRCPTCKTLLRLRGKPPSPARPAPPPRVGSRSPAPVPSRPVPAARSSKPARPKPSPPDDDVIEDAEVVRKRRKVKKRRRTDGSFEMPEWVIPLGLLAFAVITNASIALRNGGEAGKALLAFSLIDLAVTVPVTIGGMFVAAAALGVNFGGVFTAIIKVAAIAAVVQCIYTVGMSGGGDGSSALVLLLAAPVYWGLFAWLFGLTFVEALQATFFIGLIQKVVNVVVMLLAAGILLKVAAGAP
jgi:hypothetical protein